jgi:hypothetical protein
VTSMAPSGVTLAVGGPNTRSQIHWHRRKTQMAAAFHSLLAVCEVPETRSATQSRMPSTCGASVRRVQWGGQAAQWLRSTLQSVAGGTKCAVGAA